MLAGFTAVFCVVADFVGAADGVGAGECAHPASSSTGIATGPIQNGRMPVQPTASIT